MANALCAVVRQFGLKQSCNRVLRCIATSSLRPQEISVHSTGQTKLPSFPILHGKVNFTFVPNTINIEIPPARNIVNINEITNLPIIKIPDIYESTRIWPIYSGILENNVQIDLPSRDKVIEKWAHRMIVIRRKKMKKHKKRKLKKRMEHITRTIREQRYLRREKKLHADIIAKLKEAEDFDAKAYVKKRLEVLTRVPPPTVWEGVVLPTAMVQEFMEEHRRKKEARRNRVRLTLD